MEGQHRETYTEQEFDDDGDLRRSQEKTVQKVTPSTIKQLTDSAILGVTGIVILIALFTVAIGGVKLLGNTIGSYQCPVPQKQGNL